MRDFCLITALSCVLYALTWWSTGWSLSPDGLQYERMARDGLVPQPYARRWFLPWILGHRVWNRWPAWPLRRRWCWAGAGFTVLSAVLTAYYAAETLERRVLAVLLFAGLPGIWRLNVRLPMLVDPAAYCMALGCALCLRAGFWLPSVLLYGLGASIKETSPLFAAVFAWSPWPLLGILQAGIVSRLGVFQRKIDLDPTETYLQHPMLEARKVHDFFDPRTKLLPWGAVGILAVFGAGWNHLTLVAAVALAIAYAQLAVAIDNARLYQWAAPAVIAVALAHPPSWAWIVAVLGLWNPYRGT